MEDKKRSKISYLILKGEKTTEKRFAVNSWSLIVCQTGKIAIFLFSLSFFVPTVTFAACINTGATVVYINGIFTSPSVAQSDLDQLRGAYKKQISDSSTKFINGYNPSHIAGIGDITQAAAQTLDSSISSFDLKTILLQIHPQITTRKLVLVGHSQGTFYANEVYNYLIKHGEPKSAVGVYLVASPASYVAGGGKYLTSSNDLVINAARLIASNALDGLIPLAAQGLTSMPKLPMPANITLSTNGYGHMFSGTYLAEAPERVVGDIQATLKNLKAEGANETGECFVAPDTGLGYQTAQIGYTLADVTASSIKTGIVAAGNTLTYAALGAYNLATQVGLTIGSFAGITNADTPDSPTVSYELFKKIYGSILTQEEYDDLLSDLGGSVAYAPIFAAAPAQNTPEEKKIIYLTGGAKKDAPETVTEEPASQEEPAAESPAEPVEEPEVDPVVEIPVIEDPQEPPIHVPSLFTIASQEDESNFCNDPEWGGWLNCYVDPEVGIYTTNLGAGLSGALDSLTIAKDPTSPYSAFHPYLITIECFVDAYITPCTDWVTPGPATGNRRDAVIQKASESSDGKYWTAYFMFNEGRSMAVAYPTDAEGNAPVHLVPAYYYRLIISDSGWSTGVYGSATEPYWILRGIQ